MNKRMQRREFISQAGIIAIGMGAFGSIRWTGNHFTGDSPTTTDILGPFYRPGAPLRTKLIPPDFTGDVLHLAGSILKEDGTTPARGCLIEIWQCQPDRLYDNVSDEFRYRASQITDRNGKYRFTTAIPIAYPTDENPNIFRPAHIHLRISADGLQDLITQIYLKGDPHLETDPSTRSPLSINRILPLKKIGEKESEIRFDIVLKKEYLPDDSVFTKVSGVYKMSDGSTMEFFREKDLLFWKWNGVIWGGLAYAGNNTFTGGVQDTEAKFLPGEKGAARLEFRLSRRRQLSVSGNKMLSYHQKP